MSKHSVKTGDIFLAHNKYMNPPKPKFHLCINEKMYLIINSKSHDFNCEIFPDDCSLLEHLSYIDCTSIRIEPIKEFKIIKVEEISTNALKRLIQKLQVVPTIPNIQKNNAIKDLEACLAIRELF